MKRAFAAFVAGIALLAAVPAGAGADFGFLPGEEGFAVRAIADGADPATVAGSHPYQLDFELGLNPDPGAPSFPDGDIRDLRIELPPGLIVNPAVVSRCPISVFNTPRSSPYAESDSGESCPDRSQVGTVEVQTTLAGGETRRFGLFNLTPPPGVPAQLGFAPYGAPVVLDAHLRPDSSGRYALTIEATDIPQLLDLSGVEMTLWGTPWAASHDGERGNCLNEAEPQFPWAKCRASSPTNKPLAYVTMPGSCAPSLDFLALARAWQQPAAVSREAANLDAEGQPAPIEGCDSLDFLPEAEGLLTSTRASSPSGYRFRLTDDQAGLTDPAKRAPTPPRRAVVELPPGTTVNPSVGAGLGVCAPAGFERETAFSAQGDGCPNSSKIGEFSVLSPLFETALGGSIYLAAPDDPATAGAGAENPFDSLIAIYLVAKLPARGVLVKVAGRIEADPDTGELTGIFEGLPQLPYDELEFDFRAGQRAFLVSPASCGPATTRVEMTPWSGDSVAQLANDSQVTSGINGGPCPSAAAPPFSPGAVAGGVNANVGSYTPYFVRLTRADHEQEITSYSLVLPEGISGKLAGIPFCGEAEIAAARSRRGFAETADPSCPAASQVGHTDTGYGVGAALTYAPGKIYLAGPYKGQPLSLVTINAATVGPFDLGTIVTRSAFAVDPLTAQLQIDAAASDPIPHIIAGIPLHLREVRVHIDRHEFTRNPTGCEASQMISTLTGSGARFDDQSDDSTATVSAHFQLLNCLTLGFRPRLGLRLRGGTGRGAYPSLRAAYATRGARDANLRRIAVTMPRSLFVAQEHIRGVCTPVRFAAEDCPRGSIYGRAVAHTQLLDEPLRGKVYLRSNRGERPLPDLVTSLRSGEVRIVIEGRVGSSKRGGVRVSFHELPDAPIERFVLIMRGGRRGLLVNSANICAAPPRATVKALGHNNRGAIFSSRLRGQCNKKKQKQRKRRPNAMHRRGQR
ncbi:MAG: hypothetical protein WD649_04535 [Thermoleophilaceae bacterium]